MALALARKKAQHGVVICGLFPSRNGQHMPQQFWIDRRSAGVAVISRHLRMNIRQRLRDEHVNPPQQVCFRNALIEIKRIKELGLIGGLASHHRWNPSQITRKWNHADPLKATGFSTASVKLRPSLAPAIRMRDRDLSPGRDHISKLCAPTLPGFHIALKAAVIFALNVSPL